MSKIDDVKLLISNLLPDNSSQSISAQDARDSFDLVLNNLGNLNTQYLGAIVPTDAAITGVEEGATVLPLEDGTYVNFNSLERANELCVFVYLSGAWRKRQTLLNSNIFPVLNRFDTGNLDSVIKSGLTHRQVYASIRHIELYGFDPSFKYAVSYVMRNLGGLWAIKISKYDGGWVEVYYSGAGALTENAAGVATIDRTIGTLRVKAEVDWSFIPDNFFSSNFTPFYFLNEDSLKDKDIFEAPCFVPLDADRTQLKNLIPSNTATYEDTYKAIKSLELYGFDPLLPHSLSFLSRDEGGKWAIKISKFINPSWIDVYYSTPVDVIENAAGIGVLDAVTSTLRVRAEIDFTVINSGSHVTIPLFPAQVKDECFKLAEDITPTAKMLAKRVDDKLFIASKYDDASDLIICFQKCMANELMTFSYIQLVDNPAKGITQNVEVQTGELLIGEFNGVHGDNIGPVQTTFSSVQYEVGGNHLQNGNQTAETTAFKFLADGKELQNNELLACDKIEIIVRNDMFNGKDAFDSAARNHYFYEDVSYKVIEGSIEVLNHHSMTYDSNIDHYFGMQLLQNSNWMDKVYYARNGNSALQVKWNGAWVQTGSDDVNANPNLFKTIICNDAQDRCCAMSMDRVNGLGDGTADISVVSFLLSSSNGKMYYNLISGNPDIFQAGTSHYWHGCYSFFNNKATQGDNFAYKSTDFDKSVLNIDFLAASSEEVDFGEYFKKFTDVGTDGTVTINNDNEIMMPRGIEAEASAYGVMKVLVDK